MRTSQQAMKDAIESGAVQAWIEGKKIQFRDHNSGKPWITDHATPPSFSYYAIEFRPAPEPKLRPWKPQDVPPVAIFRDESWSPHFWALILGVGLNGIEYAEDAQISFMSYDEAAKRGLYSTDGGKTWHPCGVMEGGE